MKIFSRNYCAVFGSIFLILVTGLIIGSIYDLQISLSIANQNSIFGMICASFGETFGWGMMAVFGTMAFRIAKKADKMVFKILLIAFGCLVIGVSFYLIFADMNSSHNGFKEISNLPLRLILSAVIVGVISFASYKIINTEDTKLLLCAWIILMIAYYIPLAINFITKSIVMRPRFRLISSGYETYSVFDLFEPWYKAGTGIAQEVYPSNIINSDDFKSFPSGHSFVSMSSVLLSYLPLLNKRLKNEKWAMPLFLGVAALYGFTIEFARILYGAHYLSDTTFGGLLAVIFAFSIPFAGFKVVEKKKWCLL